MIAKGLTRRCSDGCGNTMAKGSYGDAFNAGQGGVYATWVESSAIKIWWWSRKNIPKDITAGSPNPDRWGRPASQFLRSSAGCNVGKYFKGLTIVSSPSFKLETMTNLYQIINTDFCGSNIPQDVWEQECQASTGSSTCDGYVTNHPEAFRNTYWLFNSIKLYN